MFRGDLIKGRTVLLVVSLGTRKGGARVDLQTHHVALVAPMASYILALHEDGSVKSAGPIDEAVIEDKEDQGVDTSAKELQAPEEAKKDKDAKDVTQLVKDEEKAEGRISRPALFSFFRYVET